MAIHNARLFTERKQVEEALRSSEVRFRTMIEQSPLSIQSLPLDARSAWYQLRF